VSIDDDGRRAIMHQRLVTSTPSAERAIEVDFRPIIRLRGAKGNPMSEEGLVPEGTQPLLLYPSEDAVELNAETLPGLSQGKPITLIVPDGNWKQASKVGNRIEVLKGVPWVKLPPGPISEYQLRREPNAYSVCTFEAIARALGVIEGVAVQEQLELFFRTVQDRLLYARGTLKPELCTGGIPPEDREWIRLSGSQRAERESLPE
jgi:hypothetical protein